MPRPAEHQSRFPSSGPQSTPRSLRQAGPRELEIVWSDGHVSLYAVADLRRACPCASCVDELTGERILKAEEVAEDVKPASIEPVGRYALGIIWSDGHSTGIYAFEYLRSLCPCAACAGGGSTKGGA
jgi:ATP-binding protein involved in chromosome partitioning